MNSSAKLIIFPPIRKIFLKKLGTSTFSLCFQDYFPKNLGKYLLVSENNTTFAIEIQMSQTRAEQGL